jgi:hypothetical protein
MTYQKKIKFGGILLLLSIAVEILVTCVLTTFPEYAAITAVVALMSMMIGWIILIDGLVDYRAVILKRSK